MRYPNFYQGTRAEFAFGKQKPVREAEGPREPGLILVCSAK
jgi:hypothetical protein